MDIATVHVHLFVPYVTNELFFGTIRLLGLLAGACSMYVSYRSVVVRTTCTCAASLVVEF